MPQFASSVVYGNPSRRAAPVVPARSWRLDPRRFGRARLVHAAPAEEPQPYRNLAADLRLFAITFLAGFLFVSILLA